MKVFIVFIAIVIVFSSVFVIRQDMATLKELSKGIKEVAAETAAGAAMAAYPSNSGQPECDEYFEKINVFADYMAEKYSEAPLFSGFGTLFVTASAISSSAVKAVATFELTNPLFSLFGGLYSITRSSVYEWVK